MWKVKIIIPIIIIVIVGVWLVTTVKNPYEIKYSIQTLEQLCNKKDQIFTNVILNDFSNSYAKLLIGQHSELSAENFKSKYAHMVREKYDINPILYSNILEGLTGRIAGCSNP